MQSKGIIIRGKHVVRYNGLFQYESTGLTAARHQVVPGSSANGNRVDPNQWSYTIQDQHMWRGLHTQTYLVNGDIYSYDGVEGSGWGPEAPAWDRDLVYNMALEKLNAKARGELDLSIALAEAGTTYRMVRSISKVLDFARMRRFGNTKDLANGWLQWQYGWKPLVSDVFQAADESIRVILNRLERVRVRATLPIKVNSSYTSTRCWDATPKPVMANGNGKQSCTIGVWYQVPSFDPARWSSLNPVSITWELIPYSFVFDWFYDVGSWLRAVETGLLYGGAFRSGYVSELFRYEGQEICTSYTYQSGLWRYGYHNIQGSIRKVQFQRLPLSSWPLPRKPTFRVDLGAQRMLSAAALLRQLLR